MDHRKYHWLYFLLGFFIAVIVATLMGCEQGTTSKGKDCIGFGGMTIEGETCEPEPPVYCCAAMMPECMACKEGISEDEWLKQTCGENAIGAEYAYWDEEKNEPIWLCQAEIID